MKLSYFMQSFLESQCLHFFTCHILNLCLRHTNFFKKETPTQELSSEFYEIFKNSTFTEHLRWGFLGKKINKCLLKMLCSGKYPLLLISLWQIIRYSCSPVIFHKNEENYDGLYVPFYIIFYSGLKKYCVNLMHLLSQLNCC